VSKIWIKYFSQKLSPSSFQRPRHQTLADTDEVATGLVDFIIEKPIPIITSWVGGTDIQKGWDFLIRLA